MEEELDNRIQLYVNVNNDGTIKEHFAGSNIVPATNYNFYFMVEPEVADDVDAYKVVMNGLEAQLVKK